MKGTNEATVPAAPKPRVAERPEIITICRTDTGYPESVRRFLGDQAPETIFLLGNLDILRRTKIALFCSVKCPGKQILRTYDLARKWRDEGKTVISGFHSLMEKECLRILLRGRQPIIICPARSLEGMRLPIDWKKPLADDRLLLLSPFPARHRRSTADLATRRNLLVAALADQVYFAHATPGGKLESLQCLVEQWKMRDTMSMLSHFPK
ncbi:MAG: DNA-processing protein DprA [candidate division Zixibacteria bacterium]|nr:DNA-processing protein DprA [candidate division Zixibacteria bacterium]